MTLNDIKLKGIEELTLIAESIYNVLVKSSSRIPKLIGYQVYLIEVFAYEFSKYKNLGYCDFEIAFVSYKVVVAILQFYNKENTVKAQDLIQSLHDTVSKKSSEYAQITSYLIQHSASGLKKPNSSDPSDSLIDRFRKLKSSSETSISRPLGSEQKNTNFSLLCEEYISAEELYQFLYFDTHKKTVLLIDFRKRKDFDYNHIKYEEIINIEPETVSLLMDSNTAATDADLEERLESLLPDTQYQRFRKRYTYDLIVFYNLYFGPKGKKIDKFVALENSLINADNDGLALRSPFRNVIDILMYKNKYISSRLKHHPYILSGGVKNWFEIYGADYLEKSEMILSRPESSFSVNDTTHIYPNSYFNASKKSVSIEKLESPYFKSFGDYLSTARSNSPAINTNSSKFLTRSSEPSFKVSNDFVGSYQNNSDLKISHLETAGHPQQQAPVRDLKRRNSATNMIKKSFGGNKSSLSQMKISQQNSSDLDNIKESQVSTFLEGFSTGLTNLGNSCYMNCVIQCLSSTPRLTKFFFPQNTLSSPQNVPSHQSYRQHINVNNKLGSKGVLTTNFVKLLMNMFTNDGNYYTPTSFKQVMGSLSPEKKFATSDQQDCVEFLNFLLDGLHEDLNQMQIMNAEEKRMVLELTEEQEKTRELLPVRLASTIEWERYLKLNFSIIVDYFQGQFSSCLKCLECGNTSTTYNAFSILSLPIPEKLNSNSSVSLYDCLEEFTATELLDDLNKWHCPRCKRFTRSTKKITITRLPQILIINLTRFEINSSGYFNKLNTFVQYPVNSVLDLTPYWPKVGTKSEATKDGGESISESRELEILSTLPTRNQSPPFQYKLYGVINHYGNLTTGHYTSYVYKKDTKKVTKGWCYFDDSKVTYKCKENQVLNQNAYCLFYVRI